jgi:uncharacterized membrane protein YbhN (UPF0104 family)
MLKLLQISITSMFILTVLLGVLTFLFAPQKLSQFNSLVDTVYPIFTTVLVPALIGRPLKDAVNNLTAQKDKTE